jgi:outer membrane murein-binding lipoprotein Lpp
MTTWTSNLCKLSLGACLATGALLLAGCPETNSQPANPSSANGSGADDHGHEHGEEGHAHHHHGPHGGHIGVIGNEEYHVEWTHDGGKVSFYILDADAKNAVPIEAEQLTVEVKIGDQQPASYELVAVDPQDGKASQFSTDSKDLEGALDALSENVTATIKDLTIGGKAFGDVKVEEHDHGHDHAHDHGDHKH